jgi:hypothetical protein
MHAVPDFSYTLKLPTANVHNTSTTDAADTAPGPAEPTDYPLYATVNKKSRQYRAS